MNLKSAFASSLLASLFVASVSTVASAKDSPAPQVQYQTANADALLVAGTGCTKDVDTFIIANGGDVAVVFANLYVDLGGGYGDALADRKTCAVRIPVSVQGGYYVREMTQRFNYGVSKTSGSNVAIATRASLLGFGAAPLAWSFPTGTSLDEPQLTAKRTDRFTADSPLALGMCNSERATAGFFAANVAISAQRSNFWEELIVDSYDTRLEISTKLARC